MTGYVQTFDINFRLDAEITDDYSSPFTYSDMNLFPDGDPLDDIEDSVSQINRFGDKLGVIEIETTNRHALGGNTATAKTVFPDGFDASALSVVKEVGVEVEARIGLTTTFSNLNTGYGALAFTGEVVGVTENEEGVISMELAGITKKLTDYTVRLETEKGGQPVDTIVDDLLGNEGGFERADEYFDYEADYYININDPDTVQATYGADTNATLQTVLHDLAHKQDAFVFVDEANRINFIDHALGAYYAIEHVIDMDTGDENSTNDRVIVESSYDTSGTGAFASNSFDQSVSTVEATNADEQNKRRLRDDNLIKGTTESRAGAEFRSDQLASSSGTITVPGHPAASPNDQVVVPNLGLAGSVSPGEYTVKEVIHRVNASDGFITELQLGTSLDKIYNQVYDSQGTDGIRRWTQPEFTDKQKAMMFAAELAGGGTSGISVAPQQSVLPNGLAQAFALADAADLKFEVAGIGFDYREKGIDKAPDKEYGNGIVEAPDTVGDS